jgi:pyruvate formate lyase activating enzyme
MKGLLFDAQGFSVHDGPGCRSLIFLKGCPLRCGWCANPEGINPYIEIMHSASKCVRDLACASVCSMISADTIDRNKCRECPDHRCVGACGHGALRTAGYYIDTEELMKKIRRDRQYWGYGGGVTLSGGEPMLQADFTMEILRLCYDSYISTAIETSGFAGWKDYEKVIEHLDWIFFDLKHMDDELHRQGTGASNRIILENARNIASSGRRVVFRIPVIPGFNDSDENMRETAEFVGSTDAYGVNVLPFHKLGASKYEQLGRDYEYKDTTPPDVQKMEHIRGIFEERSIKCWIGGSTPF